MVETKCIYGDCEYVEEQLNQYLNDGWNVLDMKTTLYDSTAGIRRDTTAGLPGITSIFLRGAAERRATDGNRTPEEPGSCRLPEAIIRRKKSSTLIRLLRKYRERRDCSLSVPAQRKEIQDHPLPQGIIVLEPR